MVLLLYVEPVSALKSLINLKLRSHLYTSISLVEQQFVVTHRRTVSQETEKKKLH
jgi:hypothetical protein